MDIGLIFKFIDKTVVYGNAPGGNYDQLVGVRQPQPLSDMALGGFNFSTGRVGRKINPFRFADGLGLNMTGRFGKNRL